MAPSVLFWRIVLLDKPFSQGGCLAILPDVVGIELVNVSSVFTVGCHIPVEKMIRSAVSIHMLIICSVFTDT